MATMFYDKDADIELIRKRKVAVIGYGSQGHAHALNLQDSGADVVVGLQAGSKSAEKAKAAGLKVLSVAEASKWADMIMVLIPDQHQARVYKEEIEQQLTAGKMLMFAHGFAIRFNWIVPPKDVDVTMVAPKAPGHRVREVFKEGAGTPGLLAVHQDVTGKGRATALAYARAIGCTRAGVIETTFPEETETDLIVDLMYRGGLQYMRYSISDTAEYGDYTAGPKIVTAETKKVMKQILADIQDGTFAKNWIAEAEGGYQNFKKMREADRNHPIEVVGAKLRNMMPFLDPVQLPQ